MASFKPTNTRAVRGPGPASRLALTSDEPNTAPAGHRVLARPAGPDRDVRQREGHVEAGAVMDVGDEGDAA